MANCINIQRSLDWCMGTPELPGIKRRVYYIAKNQIVKWPAFLRDDNGRVSSSTLVVYVRIIDNQEVIVNCV